GFPSYTEPLAGRPARNPYALELGAGGSSGGAAVAVAAGLLPVAPGSHGGGSVRIPAAATGLVGLKPSRGRVPAGSGFGTLAGLVVAGPLARTVADAALLLDALAAPPGSRAAWATAPPEEGGDGPFLAAATRGEGRFQLAGSYDTPWVTASRSCGSRRSQATPTPSAPSGRGVRPRCRSASTSSRSSSRSRGGSWSGAGRSVRGSSGRRSRGSRSSSGARSRASPPSTRC